MAKGGRPGAGGGGKPSRGAAPARLKQTRRPAKRPPRRRRSFVARAGQRGVALAVLAITALAITAVAVTGALTSSGSSATTQAAATTSATPAPTPAATKSSGPLGPTVPGQHSTHPRPHLSHSASLAPATSTSPAAAPAPSSAGTSADCGSSADRVSAARRLLQHQDALRHVTLVTAPPRPGLLGAADAQSRTLTLYVRGCSEEPTLELAVVWGYEAGQFIRTETWDSATKSRWNQLRGATFSSNAQFKQDAASVFAFWQTGSTQYWQSSVAPPSYSQLSQLVQYLKTS